MLWTPSPPAMRHGRTIRRGTTKETIIKAEPAAQRALLELARIDGESARLRHRRTALPELATIKELMGQRASLLERYTAAETQVGDLAEAHRKAEQDLEPVRARRTKDQEKLDSGAVADPKALRALQSELESLDRRISDLEDAELEVMEAVEQAKASFDEVKAERIEIEHRIRELMTKRDEWFREIDADLEGLTTERTSVTAGIDAALLALYDKVAARNVTGAAEVDGGRCTGCRIDLDPSHVAAVQDALSDDVMRCDECGRILVR